MIGVCPVTQSCSCIRLLETEQLRRAATSSRVEAPRISRIVSSWLTHGCATSSLARALMTPSLAGALQSGARPYAISHATCPLPVASTRRINCRSSRRRSRPRTHLSSSLAACVLAAPMPRTAITFFVSSCAVHGRWASRSASRTRRSVSATCARSAANFCAILSQAASLSL